MKNILYGFLCGIRDSLKGFTLILKYDVVKEKRKSPAPQAEELTTLAKRRNATPKTSQKSVT